MLGRRNEIWVGLVCAAVLALGGCLNDGPQAPDHSALSTPQSYSQLPVRGTTGSVVSGEYIVILKRDGAGGPQTVAAPEAQQLAASVGAVPRHTFGTVLAGFSARLDVAQLAALRADARVDYIEPNRTIRMVAQTIPWGISRVKAPAVHGQGIRGAGVKVGVIDTGVDHSHPDLAANYAGGTDFANNDNDPMDDNGHGTHVSGTIAALDNAIGVIGVAPDARLYGIKVLDRNGSGTFADVIAGIDWAAANGMNVVNMSLGASVGSNGLKSACDNAFAAGVVLCAAAGNDYGGPVNYPAKYSSVIAVASTTQNDSRSNFSNVGPEVELAAPGSSVYSTYAGGGYATLSGTSMATPHVAGVAALLWSTGNFTTPTGVRDQLDNTANDLGPAGRDDSFGFGLVDAAAAVGGGGPGNQPPVANANGPYSGTVGSAVSFSSAGSSDPDGSIVSYDWDFGDGATSSSANPSHTYNAAGTYAVNLTVTDDQGATDTATTSASITTGGGGADVVTITKAQYDAKKLKLTVEAVSDNPSATLTVVGFGTMTFDSKKGIWKLKKSGVDPCPVTVTVESDLGGSDSSPVQGCSGGGGGNQPPVANANGPYSGMVGSAVSFSSAGSNDPDGSIVSYAWDFGDGASSGGANPSHTYNAAGTYTVSLTVTDDQGATDTATTTASITTGGGGADVVTITKAQYDAKKLKLTVEAVSDNPSATLTVVGFGTMTFDSKKGIWKFKKSGVNSAPATVTVTSDFGGSDTAQVQVK